MYTDKSLNASIIFRSLSDADIELSQRERILIATYETILEDQISGTRLRKIAKKSGITPGHLHYYFDSKEELLLELRNSLIQLFNEERRVILADKSGSALRKVIALFNLKKTVIQGKALDYVLFDFWVQCAPNRETRKDKDIFYRPWREVITEVITSGVESGEFCSKYADLMPSFLISLMDGAALQFLIDDQAFDLDEYFQKAGELISEILSPKNKLVSATHGR